MKDKLFKRENYLKSIRDTRFKKGSKKWNKINNKYKHIVSKRCNKIKDFQHKISKIVIDKCLENDISKLIVGDIKVKKVIKKENKKINGESKSTVSLSRFKTFLEYKSKNVGLEFISVNEAFTTQQNSLTGEIMYNSSDLSIRNVELKEGLIIDRDLNSAINIAKKTKVKWSNQELNYNLIRMTLKDNSLCVKQN